MGRLISAKVSYDLHLNCGPGGYRTLGRDLLDYQPLPDRHLCHEDESSVRRSHRHRRYRSLEGLPSWIIDISDHRRRGWVYLDSIIYAGELYRVVCCVQADYWRAADI